MNKEELKAIRDLRRDMMENNKANSENLIVLAIVLSGVFSENEMYTYFSILIGVIAFIKTFKRSKSFSAKKTHARNLRGY